MATAPTIDADPLVEAGAQRRVERQIVVGAERSRNASGSRYHGDVLARPVTAAGHPAVVDPIAFQAKVKAIEDVLNKIQIHDMVNA